MNLTLTNQRRKGYRSCLRPSSLYRSMLVVASCCRGSPPNRTTSLSILPKLHCMEWFKSKNQKNVFEWPSQSPCLNLCQELLFTNCFHKILQSLREEERKNGQKKKWAKISRSRCAKLLEAYPR